ncbi:pro-adrenomedullin [Hyla sarda]|uniref:pro-adrenomedullin n=1 Tax=Hyla sarda TaxID=327740 RepID=UPI0024C35F86|nr:pro-adrenomedullin [Hyla sarda]
MDFAYVVFFHITYLSFLGSVAGRIGLHGERKTWKFLEVRRARRDLQTPVQSPDAIATLSFVKPEDTKDSRLPQSSNVAHIRVKRYRHSFGNYPQMSRGCKFGTCIVHNLANQIYQYTDKDKDITAPARKISSQGYGRRRRRSVPERRLLMPFVDGAFRPRWVRRTNPATTRQLRPTKGKMWPTLLRT